ncbi:hypothetical protein ACFLVG_00160 [Chloroflexota bacterium]
MKLKIWQSILIFVLLVGVLNMPACAGQEMLESSKEMQERIQRELLRLEQQKQGYQEALERLQECQASLEKKAKAEQEAKEWLTRQRRPSSYQQSWYPTYGWDDYDYQRQLDELRYQQQQVQSQQRQQMIEYYLGLARMCEDMADTLDTEASRIKEMYGWNLQGDIVAEPYRQHALQYRRQALDYRLSASELELEEELEIFSSEAYR